MAALIDWLLGREPEPVEQRALGDMNIATVEVWPGYVVPVTEAYSMTGLAAKLPAAYRARTMTINTVAQLPVTLPARVNTPALVRRPDPDTTRGHWVRETIASLIDYGNAYWELVPPAGPGQAPVALRVLNPAEMRVTWADGMNQDRRVYTYRRRVMTHGRNLWHLSMARGRDELQGRGPMQHTRLSGVAAALDYSQQFFLNSAEPSGVLSYEGDLTDDQADAIVARWIAKHAPQTRTPAVLAGGLKWESSGLSPRDSDWVATHGAGILDVAQIFGIPARLLGYSQPGSSLTYSNISDVYLSWWRETLQPDYVAPIEEAWGEITGVDIEFDPRPLLRANLQERYDLAANLIRTGFDPAASLDALGLPAMEHTGVLPITVQDQEEQDGIPNPVA